MACARCQYHPIIIIAAEQENIGEKFKSTKQSTFKHFTVQIYNTDMNYDYIVIQTTAE